MATELRRRPLYAPPVRRLARRRCSWSERLDAVVVALTKWLVRLAVGAVLMVLLTGPCVLTSLGNAAIDEARRTRKDAELAIKDLRSRRTRLLSADRVHEADSRLRQLARKHHMVPGEVVVVLGSPRP